MSFLRMQQDLEVPKVGDHMYHGVVVDNDDPLKLDRLRVRIQELHGTDQDISDERLPWAIHLRPSFLGGDTDLSTKVIPRVGSSVIVSHIRGDIYNPSYYFEATHEAARVTRFEDDYPESYGFQDSDNNYWHVNMVQDTLEILFNGTQILEITIDRQTTIGKDDILDIIRDRVTTVGRDDTLDILGDRTSNVGGDEIRSVSGNVGITVVGSKDESAQTITQNIGTSKDVTVPTLNIISVAGVNITSPLTTINGNLLVNGIITSTGLISGGAGIVAAGPLGGAGLAITGPATVTGATITIIGGDVIADGKSLKLHIHTAPSGGGPTSPPL